MKVKLNDLRRAFTWITPISCILPGGQRQTVSHFKAHLPDLQKVFLLIYAKDQKSHGSDVNFSPGGRNEPTSFVEDTARQLRGDKAEVESQGICRR